MIYLPSGQTLEVASATGKECKNHDAEVKALKQGAQAVIDLTYTNSEDVVFPTDSRSVLAGHGEHNIRRKLYSILEHREWSYSGFQHIVVSKAMNKLTD